MVLALMFGASDVTTSWSTLSCPYHAEVMNTFEIISNRTGSTLPVVASPYGRPGEEYAPCPDPVQVHSSPSGAPLTSPAGPCLMTVRNLTEPTA